MAEPPLDSGEYSVPARLGRVIAINASALTAGRMVNAGLGIVGVALTSRYLGVDAYGTLVTVTVFTALLTALTDMGVWTIGARELARRPQERQRLMNALLTIGIGLALGGAAIGLGLAALLYRGAENALTRESIAILVLAPIVLTATAAPAGAYLISVQRAYCAAIASTAASVALLGVTVVTVTLDLGFTAVVVANAAQSVVFGVVLLTFALPRMRFRPSWDAALCAQLLRWAVPLGVVGVLTALYWRIDVVLLSLAGSQDDVGIYGLAYKVVDALYVIPAFVTVSLLPELARLANNPTRRDELVQKAFTVMQVAVVPLLVLTLAFAGEIAALAGGAAFDGAALVLRILVLGVAAGFLRAVFTEALVAADRQTQLMLATGALLAVNVALNFALIPPLGARGAAIAFAATEALALVALLALFRRIGTPPRPHRPARVALAGAAMGAVTLLAQLPPLTATGPAARLMLAGSLAAAAYAGCLYALRAMPPELHATLVAPLIARLRARAASPSRRGTTAAGRRRTGRR